MRDKTEFEVYMDIDELLYGIMVCAKWENLVDQVEQRKIASRLRNVGLDLKLSFDDITIKGTLDLSPPDENSLYSAHCIEKIFYQESLLDLNWEGSKRLRSLLNSTPACSRSRSHARPHQVPLMRMSYAIMIQVRPFEEPVRKIRNGCLHDSEYCLVIRVHSSTCANREIIRIYDLQILAERRSK
jgi:hypothetical protein